MIKFRKKLFATRKKDAFDYYEEADKEILSKLNRKSKGLAYARLGVDSVDLMTKNYRRRQKYNKND